MKDVIFTVFGVDFTWEGIGIIIAAVFSALAFLGNIIQFIKTILDNKKNRNIQYVTDKRVEWIYKVREESAIFAAKSHVLAYKNICEPNEVEELHKQLFLIELYLNYCGPVDKIIIELMYKIINSIDIKNNGEKTDYFIQMFCNHLRIYLKVEWNRVKAETNGERYDEQRNLKELKKAYEKYEKETTPQNIISISDTIQMLQKKIDEI